MTGNDYIETAAMDETSPATSPIPIAEPVSLVEPMRPDRRRRAQEIVSKQCSRLDQLESELSDRLQQLVDEMAREMRPENTDGAAVVAEAAHEARLTALAEQVDRLRAELARREEAFSQAASNLEQARVERASLEQELHVQQALASEAQTRSEQTRIELASFADQLAEAQAQLAATRQRQEELRIQSEAQQQAWEEEREKEKAERRREARELKSQHFDQSEQLQEQQAEIARLQQSLAQAEAEQERLLGQIREKAGPRADDAQELHTLRQERDGLSQRLDAAMQKVADYDRLADELRASQGAAEKLTQQVKSRDALVCEAQDEIERQRSELAGATRKLSDNQAQLNAAHEQLSGMEQLATDLEQERIKSGRLEQELRVRDTLVAEWQSRDEQTQLEIANAGREVTDARTQLAAANERVAELETLASESEQSRAQLKKLQQALESHDASAADGQAREQRNRAELAAAQRAGEELEAARVESGKQQQELRVREALLAEAQSQQEQGRVELAAAREQMHEAQAQLAIARQRQEELRHEAAAALSAAASADAGGTGDQDGEIARLREALAAAHAESEQLAAQLRDAPTGSDSLELKQLRKESESLRKKLAAAEEKLAAGENNEEAQDQDDLRRRFELAIEELRQVKRTNEELEAKLKGKGAGSAAVGGGGGGLDWESQKRQLLASLEADDVDNNDEQAVAERQSIEGTIQITDQVVAQKDAEIEALRRQLEAGGGKNGTAVADAAAIAELLDNDEIIRSEREKLAQAQAEWREKIGKAEIDISVERAKIARDRMELEEKLRTYHDEHPEGSDDTEAPAAGKPSRGRWLTRLGLKDLNEE